jgi:hypothetical protein
MNLEFIEYEKLKHKRDRLKTNHILHLLLSILTGGLWLVIWVAVSLSNSSERAKVNKQINKLSDRL